MRSILLVLVFAITSCSSSKIVTLATQGKFASEVFNEEISCYYLGKHLFVDVVINKETYTFLFDTGFDISAIDNSLLKKIDFTPIKKQNTSGSSFEEVKLQYGSMSSVLIGNVKFENLGVGVQDLSYIYSPFSDGRKISGVIGANILRKAYWQVDYKKKVIKFSNDIKDFVPKSDAHQITMISKSTENWGINKIKLDINGVVDNFVFDTGSSGSFTANYEFLKRLEIEGENKLSESLDYNQEDKKLFLFDEFLMDNMELIDQDLLIQEKVGLLIGNDFLEEFIVTIDWVNSFLFLQPNIY